MAVPLLKPEKWMGPAIKMSLPSFSGHTVYNPNLLKYSCQIECRVRAVKPARVSSPSPGPKNEKENEKEGSPRHQIFSSMDSTAVETIENGENLCVSVMLSKPVLALEFNCLNMQVEAPIVVSHCSKNTLQEVLDHLLGFFFFFQLIMYNKSIIQVSLPGFAPK